MFTGIVDHCGTVRDIEHIAYGARATIETQFTDFIIGESIAVDGVCLTVVDACPSLREAGVASDAAIHVFSCEISPETLAKTSAKLWQKNSAVNLERALRVGDRLGGHWVTGHVDATIEIEKINHVNNYREIIFAISDLAQLNYLIPKGSVAINGVSLTINEVFADGFSVMLIPHTQKITNLDNLKIGDCVNIEFDYLVKAVIRSCPLL